MRITTKIAGMGVGLVLVTTGALLSCAAWQQHLLNERWAEVLEPFATGEAKRVARNVYLMAKMMNELSGTAKQDGQSSLQRGLRDIVIGKTGYVFVIGGHGDQQGQYLLSKRGDRDGENLWNLRDAEGRYLIRPLVDKALAREEKHQSSDVPITVEHYFWQNPDDLAPRPKTVALAYFEPWDWVIGASYYDDELLEPRQQIVDSLNETFRWLVFAALATVVLLLAVSFSIARGICRPLTTAIQAFHFIGKDRLDSIADDDSKDEISQLSCAFSRQLAARDELAEETAKRQLAEQKLRDNEIHLKHLAYHDPLTDLPNRLLFNDRLHQTLRRMERHKQIGALLFLDLDRFKNLKATLGHAMGDEILRCVSKRLKTCTRDEDTVARLGGDEFAITLENLRTELEISMVARRFIAEISAPISQQDHKLYVTASIGIALYPSNGQDVESLMWAAHIAMVQAKSLGRNQYAFYSPNMNARAVELLILENDLRTALDEGQFELYYQPQVHLDSGLMIGAEALLRWNHPVRGLILPGDFIGLAEEMGLIVPIGVWAFRQACGQIREWLRAGNSALCIAVNLSAKQFHKENLLEEVRAILAEYRTDARLLELELTESVVMDDAEHAIGVLTAFRDMGIGLAIDDFGTGYSSLGYLKRFPIQKLKIDRQFVRDINTDHNDAAIVEATLALARSLELDVVAEGIETFEQLAFLKNHGCRLGQGYLFGKPVPAGEFSRLYLDANPSEPAIAAPLYSIPEMAHERSSP